MIKGAAADPRTMLDQDKLREAVEERLPRVRRSGAEPPMLAIALCFAVALGVVTFFVLSGSRVAPPEPSGVTAALPAPPAPPAPPPAPVVVKAPPPAPVVSPKPEKERTPIRSDRLRAPALVIDYGSQTSASEAGAVSQNSDALGVNEAFAARVGNAENAPVRATQTGDLGILIPEGTIITGVLETALNSDLPGYVRAVIDHDVRSFDASRVLIPRGSRLVGQYRSGLAIGESRAFVIWTRILRPDGVSVQLSSPATDTLGRSGLTGKVDRHFFKRFGSAILLSIIGGGMDALSSNESAVVVGTAGQAQSLADTALAESINIPPTVKVRQGAAIRIFTARDLYFPQDAEKPASLVSEGVNAD